MALLAGGHRVRSVGCAALFMMPFLGASCGLAACRASSVGKLEAIAKRPRWNGGPIADGPVVAHGTLEIRGGGPIAQPIWAYRGWYGGGKHHVAACFRHDERRLDVVIQKWSRASSLSEMSISALLAASPIWSDLNGDEAPGAGVRIVAGQTRFDVENRFDVESEELRRLPEVRPRECARATSFDVETLAPADDVTIIACARGAGFVPCGDGMDTIAVDTLPHTAASIAGESPSAIFVSAWLSGLCLMLALLLFLTLPGAPVRGVEPRGARRDGAPS